VIPVDLAPEVLDTLRAMKDRGEPLPRCHKGPIRSAIAGAVRRLVDDDLGGSVRPWDMPALRRRAAAIGAVAGARAVLVDENVLVAELSPGGERILFRGADGGWRLVRFADGADISLRPERTRRVALSGWGPESVLTALGLTKPDGVELEVVTEDLGQGETRTRYRYQWSESGRSIVAEEVRHEIYDGATPASSSVRAVILEGDGGVVLTGRDGSAVITEG
jgi:hypothetical protein